MLFHTFLTLTTQSSPQTLHDRPAELSASPPGSQPLRCSQLHDYELLESCAGLVPYSALCLQVSARMEMIYKIRGSKDLELHEYPPLFKDLIVLYSYFFLDKSLLTTF